MKNLILSILCFAFVLSSYGQTGYNPIKKAQRFNANTYHMGKIGVNNLSPLKSVDIRGSLLVLNTDSFRLGVFSDFYNGTNGAGAMWKSGNNHVAFSGVVNVGGFKYPIAAYISAGNKLSVVQPDSNGVGMYYILNRNNTLDGFTEYKAQSNGARIWGYSATLTDRLFWVQRFNASQFALTVLNNGKVGINDSLPDYELDIAGTTASTHFICKQNASVMTAAVDTSAGTGATISVTGNDHAGSIQIITGSSPAASGHVARITYTLPFPSGFSSVVLTPKNAATAAISGNKSVYAIAGGDYFDIYAGTTALTNGVNYSWNYVVMR